MSDAEGPKKKFSLGKFLSDVDEDAVKQWRVDDFVTLYNSTTCLLANESLIATPEFCHKQRPKHTCQR